MTEPSARAQPAWLSSFVFAGVTAALLVAATFVMFSAFMYYDDEGYVLMSLRNFSAHGGLYRDVYTQYGPFPFVLYHGLQTLGIPLTHTAGRLITLGVWAGAALWCTALIASATRNLVARLAVLVGVFVYLWVMGNEPAHPGGIIVFLLTLLAAVGYRWIIAGRFSHWAALIGVVTALLFLTKINIGVFVAFSACSWWLLHHRNDALRRWAPWGVGVLAVVMPFALMRPLLGAPPMLTYAIVFAFAAASLATVSSGGAKRVGWKELGTGIAAAGAVVAIVLLAVMLRGTSLPDLLEGLLLAPLRHSLAFSLGYYWPGGIRACAAVSFGLCIVAVWLRRQRPVEVSISVAWARIVATAALALTLARYPHVDPPYLAFGAAMPLVWIFAWPLTNESGASTSARSWLAWLLLVQCLHAFPVPGSQIAWGSVLAVPLAGIGAWEAATWLARIPRFAAFQSRAVRWATSAAVIIFVGLTGFNFAQVASRYSHGQYLAQPGAEMIRLPDNSAAMFRLLTVNANVHADMLFSLPGMFSLNLWTGLPTPTRANVTHWFSLLDHTRQQAIADALEAHPRAVVIIDRGHEQFLVKRGLGPRGLLYDYIAKNFEPVFAIDRLEFCVRRGRKIQPFLLGSLFVRASSGATADADSALLTLSLLRATASPISTVELTSQQSVASPIILSAANARLEVTPLTALGEPAGPAHAAAWPLELTGPTAVSIYYNRDRAGHEAPQATIVLRDSTGSEIALARLRP